MPRWSRSARLYAVCHRWQQAKAKGVSGSLAQIVQCAGLCLLRLTRDSKREPKFCLSFNGFSVSALVKRALLKQFRDLFLVLQTLYGLIYLETGIVC